MTGRQLCGSMQPLQVVANLFKYYNEKKFPIFNFLKKLLLSLFFLVVKLLPEQEKKTDSQWCGKRYVCLSETLSTVNY